MHVIVLYPIVVYSVDTVAKVLDKCLTYIAIEIIPINEIFCGGALNYTTIPPSDGKLNVVNETVHNISGLRINTSYEITTVALRNGSEVLNATMNEMTLQSLSKFV